MDPKATQAAPTRPDLERLREEARRALSSGRFDLADELLARDDVAPEELTHNLRVYQAELQAQTAELRESNLRLESLMRQMRRLFEALPQPAVVIDELGVIVQLNAEADRMFGLDTHAVAKPALRRVAADADARHALHAALSEAERLGSARLNGVAVLDRNQQVRRADLFFEQIAPRAGDEGARYIVLFVDQTERVKTTESLASANVALLRQHRENRALAAVARSTRAMVVVTDAHRRITWVNQAFEQLTGWSVQELVGRSPRLFQGPGTDSATTARMGMHLERGEGFNGVEVVNYTKNGDPYWVMIDVQPIFADDGQVDGYVSVQIDVTERRLNEQRLHDIEAQQRAIFNSVPDLVAAVRPDGHVSSLNSSGVSMLQLGDPADAAGRPFVEFLGPADRDTFARLQAGAMMGEERSVRVRVVGSRGRELAVELRAAPVWRDGSVQSVVLMGRNIPAA